MNGVRPHGPIAHLCILSVGPSLFCRDWRRLASAGLPVVGSRQRCLDGGRGLVGGVAVQFVAGLGCSGS